MEQGLRASVQRWGKVKSTLVPPLTIDQQFIRYTVKGILEAKADSSSRPRSSDSTDIGIENSVDSTLFPNLGAKQAACSRLVSAVLKERLAEAEALNAKKMESNEVEQLVQEEEDQSFRVPSYYSEEHVKYLKHHLSGKIMEEPSKDYHFDIRLPDDKRFSKEINGAIRTEVARRVNEMKKKMFAKMAKLQQAWNSKGVFDERVNQTRIRSLFKVELEKLKNAVFSIHVEVIHDFEKKFDLEIGGGNVEQPRYTRAGRKIRKGTQALRQIREDVRLPSVPEREVYSTQSFPLSPSSPIAVPPLRPNSNPSKKGKLHRIPSRLQPLSTVPSEADLNASSKKVLESSNSSNTQESFFTIVGTGVPPGRLKPLGSQTNLLDFKDPKPTRMADVLG